MKRTAMNWTTRHNVICWDHSFVTAVMMMIALMMIAFVDAQYASSMWTTTFSNSKTADNTVSGENDYYMNKFNSSSSSSWNQLLKEAFLFTFVYLSTTLETWIRAFAFGFGGHLLFYIMYLNPDATHDDVRKRMHVSIICGLAMGCFCFGGSMVFPSSYRSQWWE
jgi:hypothetical protein